MYKRQGFYTKEFRIFNVETGGSALWYEEIGSVAVKNGCLFYTFDAPDTP